MKLWKLTIEVVAKSPVLAFKLADRAAFLAEPVDAPKDSGVSMEYGSATAKWEQIEVPNEYDGGLYE